MTLHQPYSHKSMHPYKFIIILPLLFTLLLSQININIYPELGVNTWTLPLSFNFQPIENITIAQHSELFKLDHPIDHYIWYSYSRNDITYITEYGYFNYSKEPVQILVGRNYIPIGFGRMSGLFISPVAPSLDNVTIAVQDFHNIYYRNSVIRLDNRSKIWDGEERVAQRWYYLRSIGYKYKDFIRIDLFDAVISTGFNRSLEWYYLNPLSALLLERKHQYRWREGGDTTSVKGVGDNDNHFIGGGWQITLGAWEMYGEWLIDEWQLTVDYRDSVQTMFGVMAGLDYHTEKSLITIEYSLASPWLYINRALYGSPELHGLPLGLANPQSHSLLIQFDYQLTDFKKILVQLRFEQHGEQNFNTLAHAWDNILPVYDFKETLPVEFKLMYCDKNGKYFDSVGIYHNWFQSGLTQFIIGWSFSITM